MEAPIAFTIPQLIAEIIAICGGITVVAGAIAVIAGALHKMERPNLVQNERITELENTVKKHEALLSNDNNRLAHLEEGNKIIQESLLALLAHGIDGNDVESMKKAKAKLQQFLIDG